MGLIDRQGLLVEARKLESVITGRDKPIPVAEAFMSVIEKQPTVEPRAKGKWDFIGDNMFMCTSCGAIYTVQQLECLKQHVTDLYLPPYCPNCGSYNGENVEQPDKKEELEMRFVLKDVRAVEIENNKVNLCDSCMHEFATCDSGPNDTFFGDGEGNDNVCCCSRYDPLQSKRREVKE